MSDNQAFERVAGPEQRKVLSPEDYRTIAYHEADHALAPLLESPNGRWHDGSEPVEVAMAHDSLEAIVRMKQLEGLGIPTEAQRRGGLLRAILYLGRRAVSVRVPRKDLVRVRDHLRKFRFIGA